MGVDLEGGILGINNAIFTISIWMFSLSISWLFFKNNPYINNLIILALIPSGILIIVEFVYLGLFFDYIHILPLIIGIIILLKKHDTLKLKKMLLNSGILIGWICLDYFLGLAYSNIPIFLFTLGFIIFIYITIGISFIYAKFNQKSNKKSNLIKKILLGILIFFLIFGIFLEGVLTEWYMRPNTANIDPRLDIMSWDMINDNMHNSNTDLIFWNNSFYLVHDRRPFHLGSSDAKLLVWKSNDAVIWEKVIEFSVPGSDIRDPKFCNINGTLFLYALLNEGIMATPYQTIYTKTSNGDVWDIFKPIDLQGWLLWRPKTYDNKTWYVPAYWHEHGKSVLLNSSNGINWSIVSTINEGFANDETALEFLQNGSIIITARLEGVSDTLFGSSSACTLIAVSNPPFINYSYSRSYITRLDGPVLFSYNNKTFAIGRYQPGTRTMFTQLGSIFSKKRTSIFLLELNKLVYLTDIPSAGDTSYAGVAIRGNELYISYYTSNTKYDYPWILGMVARSIIKIVKINLTSLITIIP
ncbi:MAG: hypothetical protein ACTSPY_18015 [Candidatus Helarchaeota archaeon]